jgi:hypothetical protein
VDDTQREQERRRTWAGTDGRESGDGGGGGGRRVAATVAEAEAWRRLVSCVESEGKRVRRDFFSRNSRISYPTSEEKCACMYCTSHRPSP